MSKDKENVGEQWGGGEGGQDSSRKNSTCKGSEASTCPGPLKTTKARAQ